MAVAFSKTTPSRASASRCGVATPREAVAAEAVGARRVERDHHDVEVVRGRAQSRRCARRASASVRGGARGSRTTAPRWRRRARRPRPPRTDRIAYRRSARCRRRRARRLALRPRRQHAIRRVGSSGQRAASPSGESSLDRHLNPVRTIDTASRRQSRADELYVIRLRCGLARRSPLAARPVASVPCIPTRREPPSRPAGGNR